MKKGKKQRYGLVAGPFDQQVLLASEGIKSTLIFCAKGMRGCYRRTSPEVLEWSASV